MKIAVASGKGGTGKTTVAIALAQCLAPDVLLVDCDVEEPNCHLFYPGIQPERSVAAEVTVPVFMDGKCTGCGKCVQACRFHALARLGKRILVFPEMCHSCGGCTMICPEGCLTEQPFHIGEKEFRPLPGGTTLLSGVMDVGRSQAPPLIRQLKALADESVCRNIVFDAPPGTSCPFVTTVQECDHVVLVTEPTPFGLHDLQLAVDVLRSLNVPCSVVLNRAGNDDENRIITDYCTANGLDLLWKIPYSRAVAEGYSCGKTLLDVMPEWKADVTALLQRIHQGGCR